MPLPLAVPLALKAAPYIATGLSALAGFLRGRKKSRTSEQQQTQTISPTFLPESDPLRAALLSQTQGALGSEAELPAIDFSALRQRGISDVNRSYSGLQEALSSRLAERGLSSSPGPVSNVLATGESARFQSLNDIMSQLSIREAEQRAQLPLIREELRRQRLADAARLLPMFAGRTQTGTGTSVQPGSAFGGALESGADALFYGLGHNLFRR